jgi:imidazolonepropionase-like amidohydrolase
MTPMDTIDTTARTQKVIHNVTIVDVVNARLIPNRDIHIGNGTVTGICSPSPVRRNDVETVDASGLFLMPGLFDCHIHLAFNGFLNTKSDYTKNLKQYLLNGVTQVVDFFTVGGDFPGSSPETIREDINSGGIRGPEFMTSYGCLNAPGGFCDCAVGDAASAVVSVDDVYEEVDRIDAMRPDFIKLVYDDVFGTIPNLTPDLLGKLIDEAHRRGFRAAVHVATCEQAMTAVDQGADILGHGIIDAIPESFLNKLADRKILVVPTLASYEARSLPRPRIPLPANAPLEVVQEYWRHTESIYERKGQISLYREAYQQAVANMRPMYEAGVLIAAGSDSGTWYTFPGEGLLRELEIYREAGLDDADILRLATDQAVAAFGQGHRLGSVKTGNTANLLMLEADPLKNVSNLRRIASVILHGETLDLQRLRADLAAPSTLSDRIETPKEELCSPHHLRSRPL